MNEITVPRADTSDDDAPAPSPKQIAVVDAAQKLFLAKGFADVSMDEIAAEAQVSKRTVYSYFENKEALFAGVMHAVCAANRTEDDALEDETLDIETALTLVATSLSNIIFSPTGTAILRTAIGESPRVPSVGETFFETGPKNLIERLTAMLARHAADGTIEADDPLRTAGAFVGMVTEPHKLLLLLGVADYPSQAEIEAHVAWTVKTFLRAVNYKGA